MIYKTVIFDLDGTLLDTIEDMTDGINYVMQQFGFDQHTIEEIKSMVGNGMPKLIERVVPGGTSNPVYETVYEQYKEYYGSHCRIKTRPYDGILELLAQLRHQGFQIGIVSNKNHGKVVQLKEDFFADYIEVAIGQQENTRKKPAPDTVFMAMKELNASGQETLYVGDSEVDKMTADHAGLTCVLVSWGFRNREMLVSLKPGAVIDRPEQLLTYMEDQSRR